MALQKTRGALAALTARAECPTSARGSRRACKLDDEERRALFEREVERRRSALSYLVWPREAPDPHLVDEWIRSASGRSRR
jgi:hypothetical protein